MTDAEAYDALALDNRQGELSPLELGVWLRDNQSLGKHLYEISKLPKCVWESACAHIAGGGKNMSAKDVVGRVKVTKEYDTEYDGELGDYLPKKTRTTNCWRE